MDLSNTKNQKKFYKLFFYIAVIITFGMTAFLFCDKESFAEGEDTIYSLFVFETSDTHGYLAEKTDDGLEFRLAYISDKVKDIRGHGDQYRKEKAVLIDSGDIYQGNFMSNILKGNSLSAAYEYMDYDAVGIGNHEFDWGLENLVDSDKTMKDYSVGSYSGINDVPVVVSNLYKDGAKYENAEDYVILNKVATDAGGNDINVRIGVIGYAEDYSLTISYDKFTGMGYEIKEDINEVNAIAKNLEESGMCDATILLYHGSAYELAGQLGPDSVIDLVMGGHTHKCQKGVTPEGIEYIQPGANGQYYAYARLGFTVQSGQVKFDGVKYKRYEKTIEDVNKLYDLPENADELDMDITNLTHEVINEVEPILNQEVGYITESACRYTYIEGSGKRSNTSGNWMASILKRAGDADVAFMNSGGIRKEYLVNGDKRIITLADVYEMFPFDDPYFVYEITYGELYEVLSYSLQSAGKGIFSRLMGIKCYFTDRDVDTIETLDGNVIYVDGKWKGDWKDKKLKLSVGEFIATTNRTTGGFTNPLIAWNDTEKLIKNDENIPGKAIEILKAEAAENDGLLYIDPAAYFLEGHVENPYWYISTDGVLTIEKGMKAISEDVFKKYSDQKKVVYEGSSSEWYAMSIKDKWLIESSDVDIVCSDKTIKAASYMCKNFDKHIWDEPTYVWSADNKKVTASHICKVCEEEENETVKSVSKVTKKPTKTKTGIREFRAAFKKPDFKEQIKTEVLPVVSPDEGSEDKEKADENPDDKEVTSDDEKKEEVTRDRTEDSSKEETEVSTAVKSTEQINATSSTAPKTADMTPVTVVIILFIVSMILSMIILLKKRSKI